MLSSNHEICTYIYLETRIPSQHVKSVFHYYFTKNTSGSVKLISSNRILKHAASTWSNDWPIYLPIELHLRDNRIHVTNSSAVFSLEFIPRLLQSELGIK